MHHCTWMMRSCFCFVLFWPLIPITWKRNWLIQGRCWLFMTCVAEGMLHQPHTLNKSGSWAFWNEEPEAGSKTQNKPVSKSLPLSNISPVVDEMGSWSVCCWDVTVGVAKPFHTVYTTCIVRKHVEAGVTHTSIRLLTHEIKPRWCRMKTRRVMMSWIIPFPWNEFRTEKQHPRKTLNPAVFVIIWTFLHRYLTGWAGKGLCYVEPQASPYAELMCETPPLLCPDQCSNQL